MSSIKYWPACASCDVDHSPDLQPSTLGHMVVMANISSQRCCSCKPPSRTQNTIRPAGCDEDDVAYDVLPKL
jgi:hypothetical protein